MNNSTTMLTGEECRILTHGSVLSIKKKINSSHVNKLALSFGRNVILLACCNDNDDPAILEYLLSIGANIHAIDQDNENAIYTASRYGHSRCIRYLISKGCNPNLLSRITTRSSIDYAISYGYKDCVWILRFYCTPESKRSYTSVLQPYLACELIAYIILSIRKFRSSLLDTNDKHITLLIAKEIMKTKKDTKWVIT
jgi:ankyrin repeat protein